MDLAPGTSVDRYIVEELLGSGGMASVYRVRHAELGTDHALKVLSLTSRTIADRLRQEGRLQARLRHRNIVAVTDVVDVDGAPGLIMEFVKGPDLAALIAHQRLSLEQVDTLAQELIAAVGVAHRNDLVHRDLKPANIMMAITDAGLVPKIMDFGLAKVVSEAGKQASRTRTGSTMGTPHYMSPEQVRDSKHVGPESDVFALGAILYELVTGRRAFEGADLYEIFKAVAEGLYIPPRHLEPSLPARMEQAIVGALKVDRAERIPDCDSLLAVWNGEIAFSDRGVPMAVSQPAAPVGPWSAEIMAQAHSLSSGGVGSNPPASTGSAQGPAAQVAAVAERQATWIPEPEPPPAEVEAPISLTGTLVDGDDAPLRRGGFWLGLLATGTGALAAILVVGVGLVAVIGVAVWIVVSGTSGPRPVAAPPAVADPVAPAVADDGEDGEDGDEPIDAPRAPARAGTDTTPPSPVAGVQPDAPTPAADTEVAPQPEEDDGTEPEDDDAVEVIDEPPEATPPPAPAGSLPPDLDPAVTKKADKRTDALVAIEPDPGATAIIVEVMKTDPEAEVRVKAWRVIRARWRRGVGDAAEHQAVVVWRSDNGPLTLRAEAIMALGTTSDDPALVTRHAASQHIELRRRTLAAMVAWAKRHPARRDELRPVFDARMAAETDPRTVKALHALKDAAGW